MRLILLFIREEIRDALKDALKHKVLSGCIMCLILVFMREEIREALKDALKRFLKYLQVKKLSSENQSKLRRQLYWTSLYVIYKKCK